MIPFIMLIIAILIFVTILDYFIAGWFFEAAQAKGHYDKKYFWICFWLGFIGYALVIALPDRGNIQSAEMPAESWSGVDDSPVESNESRCWNCNRKISIPKGIESAVCPWCNEMIKL